MLTLDDVSLICRGTELYLCGGYPVIVCSDTPVPDDTEARETLTIPTTSILAYGDPIEESEYQINIPIQELQWTKEKDN